MIAVHVAQLLQAPVGTTRAYEFSEAVPILETEVGVRGPVQGRVKLTRTSHGILADVEYRAEVELECGRCLGPGRSTIEHQLSEEFLPTTNVFTGLPEEIVADLEEPRIGENHLLDVTDVIRQDIVLELPLQPRCRPDCPGLCSVCGQDLNEVDCGHAVDGSAPAEEEQLGRLGELLKSRMASD